MFLEAFKQGVNIYAQRAESFARFGIDYSTLNQTLQQATPVWSPGLRRPVASGVHSRTQRLLTLERCTAEVSTSGTCTDCI